MSDEELLAIVEKYVTCNPNATETKLVFADLVLEVAKEVCDETEKRVRKELGKFDGEPCYYCGKPISAIAADPGLWGIPLCHADEPGVIKPHHIGCVVDRLIPAEQLEKRVRRETLEWIMRNIQVYKPAEALQMLAEELRRAKAGSTAPSK